MSHSSGQSRSKYQLGLSDIYLYALKPNEVDNSPNYKLYMRRGIQESGRRNLYSFPFVDVFLGHEEDDGSTVRVWSFRYPRIDLWPTVRRPFCGMFPFAPRNSSAVIAQEFGDRAGDSECLLHHYGLV